MDLTLVNITAKNTYDGKLLNRLSTVGIYSLIACLENSGIKIDFREYFLDFEKTPSEEMDNALKFFKNSTKIIGISCHSIHLPFVICVVREIKKIFPDKYIILGGVGPSVVAQSLMEKIEEIDMIVIGEAEFNFPQVIKSLLKHDKDLCDIGGLAFRQNGKTVATSPMRRIDNLDCLPMPAYNYLDVESYVQPMVITARGCPFGCPFCSLGAFWGRRVSYRSPAKTFGELMILQSLGVKSVFFADPCFMLDKKRLREFIGAVRNNVAMEFKIYGRLDLIDRETCEMLSDANFKIIFYGLESGSDTVLQQVKGGFNVQQGLDVIKMSQKYFSRTEVSLMWGLPFETFDDFKQTINVHNYLKYELGCAVQLNWFELFANAPYFQKYKKTLFRPQSLSAIYDRDMCREQLRSTFNHAGECDYTISLRGMISHSHIYSLAKQLIDENPYLFPDFYRSYTPDLDKKIKLANKIVPS